MGALITTYFFRRGKWRQKAITGNADRSVQFD